MPAMVEPGVPLQYLLLNQACGTFFLGLVERIVHVMTWLEIGIHQHHLTFRSLELTFRVSFPWEFRHFTIILPRKCQPTQKTGNRRPCEQIFVAIIIPFQKAAVFFFGLPFISRYTVTRHISQAVVLQGSQDSISKHLRSSRGFLKRHQLYSIKTKTRVPSRLHLLESIPSQIGNFNP